MGTKTLVVEMGVGMRLTKRVWNSTINWWPKPYEKKEGLYL